MKRIIFVALFFVICLPLAIPQAKEIQGKVPKELADELWTAATRGELLSRQGWTHASQRFFTKPTAFPGTKAIRVVSNSWGPAYQLRGTEDAAADVLVGYLDVGGIDSALRYVPPLKTDAIKTAALYHFVTVEIYNTMYGPDGKTIVSRRATGLRAWQIEGRPGPPWTTVNTAIRYVLEMRARTSDPIVRKNADETLSRLLQLH